jgi:hypothetical protein
MRKLIALGLGTCLGLTGVLSGCSDGSNSATTTAGGSGAGGTTNASNVSGSAQGGNTAAASAFTPGTGPVAIADLAHEVAIAFCNMFSRCLGSSSIDYPGTITQCISSLEPTLADQVVNQITAAVTRGTTSYDATAARSCLDAYAYVACDYSNEQDLLVKCAGAWPGNVAVGGSCVSNVECASSLISTYCVSDGTCPGQCQARRQSGQTCRSDHDEQCQTNLRCGSTNDVCVPMLKVGDTCVNEDDTSGACGGFSKCQQDSASTQYHCAYRVGVTERQVCASSVECVTGLICMTTGETSDASPSVVHRCQNRLSSGATCRPALGNPCPDGQYCSIATSGGTTASTGQCVTQIAPGIQCPNTNAYECQNNGRCSSTSHACVLQQRVGGPCETSGDCFSYVCTNSVCAAPQDCSR